MNILLISLPEKNKDMKLEATEVLPLALYSLSSVLKCQGYEQHQEPEASDPAVHQR